MISGEDIEAMRDIEPELKRLHDMGGACTSENIYMDPSLGDKPWHVRHDTEIWTDDDEAVADFSNAPDAHRIVALHNAVLERGQ